MPTKARYYTTREVLAILGISRATLYNWDPEPDLQIPGANGYLKGTVLRMARAHGRVPDWSKVTP